MGKAVLADRRQAIQGTARVKKPRAVYEAVTPEEYLSQNPAITCRELDEKMFAAGSKASVQFYARALEILMSRKMHANLVAGKQS